MGMDQDIRHKWSKTVFRLRGLPTNIISFDEVANVAHIGLCNMSGPKAQIFSLSTSLNRYENPPTKVATIMFETVPSIVQKNPSANEWHVSFRDGSNCYGLILDIHFLGMTPLNYVEPLCHVYDCIAISGLASNPFGSWQPRASDKTFMWIRDTLPNQLEGIRTIIYGYDTKLHQSRSFQNIPDLAQELINHLQTYGWSLRCAKPIAFLAHSLGGLVLKEALVQLASQSNEEYGNLLDLVLGAVFFGVPNLGMEQSHFRTIVQNNPNQALVDDIARYSPYLLELNKRFTGNSLDSRIKCFWAYETLESPTAIMTPSGSISLAGPQAILVSRESATCRFVETNTSVTVPIQATHSEMVKFTRDSHILHVIISKVSRILMSQKNIEEGTNIILDSDYQTSSAFQARRDFHPYQNISQTRLPRSEDARVAMKIDLTAEIDQFRRLSNIDESEERRFLSVTFDVVQALCNDLQMNREKQQDLIYMRRLEPFLVAMEEFGEVVAAVGKSNENSHLMAYIWGPMRYVLHAASSFDDVLHSVLNVYQEIGEQIPCLKAYQSLIMSKAYLKEILPLIYQDILWFHAEMVHRLRRRGWRKVFRASWAEFTYHLQPIKESIARSRRSIENNISITEFEQIQTLRVDALHTFQTSKTAQVAYHRATVLQWLAPFDCQHEHNKHRKMRSICKSPGGWLLGNPKLKDWMDPELSHTPLLWLNGIPGAGKTILASIIIDEVQRISNNTTVFFYCKYGETMRNSLVSLARSILAQILDQNHHLLPYFHEKASLSGDALLTSTSVAEEMLQTALISCKKTYVIIDGVDECGRGNRKDIAAFFRTVVETLPVEETGSIRCLFVSQDDGIARSDFRDLPYIKITDENEHDIADFASAWHERIEEKFGALRSKDGHISNIISARAKGMFIFADLFARYLESQASRAALMEQLDPTKLPVNLDHVYERIVERVLEDRGDHILDPLRQVLGWIACARRPLTWAEIQGAISIDFENQDIDYERRLSDSPKGLFASLVELQPNGTVELVHGTARDFLIRRKIVNQHVADYSLTTLSMSYLALPQVDQNRSDGDVRTDLLHGTHSFYDYASACWASHLLDSINQLQPGDKLNDLQENLETFVEVHRSPTYKPLQDLKRIRESLKLIQASKSYDEITQAVGWARKQSSQHGQGPNPDEALDIWQVTQKIRSVLESFQASRVSKDDERKLQQFYGSKWFKCPRVNCIHYYQGFDNMEQRQHHINKHNRPYLCYVPGCHMEVFGYAIASDLKKHLLKYHGIDMFNDGDDLEFPDPPKPAAMSRAKAPATFQCPTCNKTFTRNHNLKNHLRSHEGSKPYECGVCGMAFTRKADCDRHERGHGEEKFICTGSLKDGSTWGCQKSFGRQDGLVAHYRSKTGRRCIRPKLEEKLREGGDIKMMENDTLFDGEVGGNADILQAVGRSLPNFGEFLRLCGLHQSETGSEPESNPGEASASLSTDTGSIGLHL